MKPINKFEIKLPTDFSVLHFIFNALGFRKIFNISQYNDAGAIDEHNIQEFVVNDMYTYRDIDEYNKKMNSGVGRRTNICIAKLERKSIWKNLNLYVSVVPNVSSGKDLNVKTVYRFLKPVREISSYDGYKVNVSRGPLTGGQSSQVSLNDYYVEKIIKYIDLNEITEFSVVRRGK